MINSDNFHSNYSIFLSESIICIIPNQILGIMIERYLE